MIYDFECIDGHRREFFFHSSEDMGTETAICKCGSTMAKIYSPGKIMAYYEESRPRTIWNLGPEPQTFTSYKQHKEAMKKAGVCEAGSQIPHGTGRVSTKGRWI